MKITGFPNVSLVIEFIAHHVDTTHTTRRAHGALAGGTGSTWMHSRIALS